MSTKYIMDNSAIQYMLESLPRKVMRDLWSQFLNQCDDGTTISDKETMRILEYELTELESIEWIKLHSKMFKAINQKESETLGDLIESGVFGFYNNSSSFERKLPIATPFIISIAIEQNRHVVMHKGCKDRIKIIKICDEEKITCIDVEEYLIQLKATVI
jgi:hypothetical protein